MAAATVLALTQVDRRVQPVRRDVDDVSWVADTLPRGEGRAVDRGVHVAQPGHAVGGLLLALGVGHAVAGRVEQPAFAAEHHRIPRVAMRVKPQARARPTKEEVRVTSR